MTKIGVGVGDDFPVDDGGGNPGASGQGPKSEQEEFEDWKRRRDEWRAQRERWRAQHDEWRARKRAFKERVRQAARESFGQDWDEYRDARRRHYRRHGFPFFFWPFWALIPILGIALFVSLIAAIFKSPFLFLGLAALAFVFMAYRHNRWHGRHGFCDYDFDMKPAAGPSPSGSQNNGTIVTPPPAPDNGKTAS